MTWHEVSSQLPPCVAWPCSGATRGSCTCDIVFWFFGSCTGKALEAADSADGSGTSRQRPAPRLRRRCAETRSVRTPELGRSWLTMSRNQDWSKLHRTALPSKPGWHRRCWQLSDLQNARLPKDEKHLADCRTQHSPCRSSCCTAYMLFVHRLRAMVPRMCRQLAGLADRDCATSLCCCGKTQAPRQPLATVRQTRSPQNRCKGCSGVLCGHGVLVFVSFGRLPSTAERSRFGLLGAVSDI